MLCFINFYLLRQLIKLFMFFAYMQANIIKRVQGKLEYVFKGMQYIYMFITNCRSKVKYFKIRYVWHKKCETWAFPLHAKPTCLDFIFSLKNDCVIVCYRLISISEFALSTFFWSHFYSLHPNGLMDTLFSFRFVIKLMIIFILRSSKIFHLVRHLLRKSLFSIVQNEKFQQKVDQETYNFTSINVAKS